MTAADEARPPLRRYQIAEDDSDVSTILVVPEESVRQKISSSRPNWYQIVGSDEGDIVQETIVIGSQKGSRSPFQDHDRRNPQHLSRSSDSYIPSVDNLQPRIQYVDNSQSMRQSFGNFNIWFNGNEKKKWNTTFLTRERSR